MKKHKQNKTKHQMSEIWLYSLPVPIRLFTVHCVKLFLAYKHIPALGHSSHLPDLTPCNVFPLAKVKYALKGRHFESIVL